MTEFEGQVLRFAGNEDGATAIEYGLIAALIAIGILMAMTALGGGVTTLFDFISSRAGNELDNGNQYI
jgi:pilus assembly protein Flp/PilA